MSSGARALSLALLKQAARFVCERLDADIAVADPREEIVPALPWEERKHLVLVVGELDCETAHFALDHLPATLDALLALLLAKPLPHLLAGVGSAQVAEALTQPVP